MSRAPRGVLMRVIFLLLVYLAVEAVSFSGLWILKRARGIVYFPKASTLAPEGIRNLDSLIAGVDGRLALDSTLGWRRHRPQDVNAAGMRDNRGYTREPNPDTLRISAFGDSFTYGSDVPLGQNWAKRISAIAPHIEILNYGVGAYGLDQAYLRYRRDGTEYHPNIVLIGYMTENSARDVNVFRAFYGFPDFIFSKPRFKLDNDTLVLLPNPLRTLADYRRLRDNPETVLPELGRNDNHFVDAYSAGPFDFSPSVRLGKLVIASIRNQPRAPILTADGRYETRSEAYEVTLRIFDAFYRKAVEDGALPIIVVFPDLNDQMRSRAGQPRRYDPMLQYFRSRGYRFVDVLGAFKPVESRYTINDLSVKYGHFSVLGNDLVARYILERLTAWDLDQPLKAKSAASLEARRLGIMRP